jgi:putative ABC transport system permease protein
VSGPDWVARALRLSLFGARIVGGIGLLALALAGVGLFSVSVYSVQRRTREIGIRMALGARPRDVLRAVLGPAARTLLRGLLVGAAGTLCGAFLLRGFLFGLSPLDPFGYFATALLLLAAGLVASYLPARRALSVEPTVALRYE